MKDGVEYSKFRDTEGNKYEIEFEKKTMTLKLETKIMEMFEFKEKYDGKKF